MAKYNVNFSCGHSDTIELFGKVSERMSRIEWLEKEGLCPECYAKLCAEQAEKREAAMAETHDIRRMKYSLFKSEYSDCETKKDSYDAADKTIVVYVPKKKEQLRGIMKSIIIAAEKLFHEDGYSDRWSYDITAEHAYAECSKKSGHGTISIYFRRAGKKVSGTYTKEWNDEGSHKEHREITAEELKEIAKNMQSDVQAS